MGERPSFGYPKLNNLDNHIDDCKYTNMQMCITNRENR